MSPAFDAAVERLAEALAEVIGVVEREGGMAEDAGATCVGHTVAVARVYLAHRGIHDSAVIVNVVNAGVEYGLEGFAKHQGQCSMCRGEEPS